MQDLKEWLCEYFATAAKCPVDIINTESNFFEAEYIDSFGVIALISKIESTFDIEFTENDFLDRRFSTIMGLAEIIGERSRA